MFKKDYIVTLKDNYDSDFDILLQLKNSQADYLVSKGISCNHVYQSSGYALSNKKPKYNFSLYMNLFFQDLLRGKLFNSERYFMYLFILQHYGVKLNKKQTKILDSYSLKLQQEGKITMSTEDIQEEQKSLKKIILVNSSVAGIGKSTLSKKLEQDLDHCFKLSFAESIRKSLECLFLCLHSYENDIFNPEYYHSNKNEVKKHLQDFDSFSIRDFLCDYSDVVQKHLGKECWGTSVINQIKLLNAEYIVIDDFRREIEKESLQNYYGKENIITVYLDKEDSQKTQMSSIASTYEGKVNPQECDITFTYKKDWSNSDQLLSLIKEKL